jgi:hypothetical protein
MNKAKPPLLYKFFLKNIFILSQSQLSQPIIILTQLVVLRIINQTYMHVWAHSDRVGADSYSSHTGQTKLRNKPITTVVLPNQATSLALLLCLNSIIWNKGCT